jgi:hypothetical protein
MFGTAPISMAFVSEIEAISLADIFHRGGTIGEKHGVVNVVFLTHFNEERMSECIGSDRFNVRVR